MSTKLLNNYHSVDSQMRVHVNQGSCKSVNCFHALFISNMGMPIHAIQYHLNGEEVKQISNCKIVTKERRFITHFDC